MQMEVTEIQCGSDLKANLIEVGVPEFYKYLLARLENSRNFAYEIISMLGSTYHSEKVFTITKEKSLLSDPELLTFTLAQV